MKKTLKGFFKPIAKEDDGPISEPISELISEPNSNGTSKRTREEESSSHDIISDPGMRIPIEEYCVSIRDAIRREYIIGKACQPKNHIFPKTEYKDRSRSFQKTWFVQFPWLEYIISQDATYCFYCYLFALIDKRSDDFTSKGFRSWKRALASFSEHVGRVDSVHNNAWRNYEAYSNQLQSISHVISTRTREEDKAYRTRLTAILHVIRFLLKQGLAFRGHDESHSSSNRVNFLELCSWYAEKVESFGSVFGDNAPGNNQLTSPEIQKQLVNACATQTTMAIISELGDNNFALLVDESRDKSIKEQMSVILRFVNDMGQVIERFLAIEHINDTSSRSLKACIDELLMRHGLTISRLRGQSYDGASNMREEFNGLKTLILNDNPYAFFVHCFAHQLQLVVVAVVKSIPAVNDFFVYTGMIVNVVSASCKRMDTLNSKQRENLLKKLESNEIFTIRGLHQETNLARPGDTRWGSHHITLIRLQSMWVLILGVLEIVVAYGVASEQKALTCGLIENMESFQFEFILHLMLKVLGITNDFSNALQRGDQNIVNAITLLEFTKAMLQRERGDGWDNLLDEVMRFCAQMNIPVINLDDNLPGRGRSRRGGQMVTYYHHEIFLPVLDSLLVEMNNRFRETSTELLRCMSCLDPRNSFSKFDSASLISLVEMYSEDFSSEDVHILKYQLQTYIYDMRRSRNFNDCHDLNSLAVRMVETSRHEVFPLVYRLLELVLLLPVNTSSVERSFSAMNLIKTDLRNRMGVEWMNDMMVCYIEKYIFDSIEDENILQHFQNMRTCRNQLHPI